jgi:hypothetical protein
MAPQPQLTPVRLQRARNVWLRMSWPVVRRWRRLPKVARPPQILGVDENGFEIDAAHQRRRDVVVMPKDEHDVRHSRTEPS